jgi:hypothetical protein
MTLLLSAPSLVKSRRSFNTFTRTPGIDALLTETFRTECRIDVGRAISCARLAPSRYDTTPPPVGCQRFTVHGGDAIVRAPNASVMRYTLKSGGLALDIFKRVLEEILRPQGAKFSLEFEGRCLSAYTINFGD